MGLFDRIKKAFTGKDNSEDKDLEKKSQEESEKDTDQVTEEVESPTETAKDDEVKTTMESDEKPESEIEESQEDLNPEQVVSDDEELKDSSNETVETKEDTVPGSEVTSVESEQEPESEETKPAETKTEPITDTNQSLESKETTDLTPDDTSASQEKVPESVESENTDQSEESEETEESQETTEEEATTETQEVEEKPKDDIQEYDEGLKKSRNSFGARFNRFLANFRTVDEDFFDDLEELLIESDVGYETAMRISDELREEVKLENAKKRSDVSNVIVKKLVDMYGEEGKDEDNSLKFSTDKMPTVFLFVGVNGAGKTTTVGKLAHRYQQEGKKVLLAAADTFRAGAIEQLQEWGKRVDVPVQASKAHTDPASVVFDAVKRAKEEDFDILLVDTAGRLQNKEGLMRELEKIKRVITRELPEAPQEVLLVLDGSTGQNALSQAKQFNETTDVSGIVLTKLDGSSQGGIVLAIRNELHIPVKLVGLGEQMNDLRDFDPEKFIYGLFKELIVGESDK